jgi:hypothetical protein
LGDARIRLRAGEETQSGCALISEIANKNAGAEERI